MVAMSTTIQSTVRGAPPVEIVRIRPEFGDGVSVAVSGSSVPLPRADFLAAVEVECGVIVIDRADLPKVMLEDNGHGRWFSMGVRQVTGDYTAAEARQAVRDFTALAEYLDAHPPIDEAQVEALGHAIRNHLGVTSETVARGDLRPGSSDDLARLLVAEGWSK